MLVEIRKRIDRRYICGMHVAEEMGRIHIVSPGLIHPLSLQDDALGQLISPADLEDIPASVRKSIEFIPVENFEEVIPVVIR